MTKISRLTDSEYRDLIRPAWEFLSPQALLSGSYDAIFVMGGIDLQVPRRAAALWGDGWSQTILVTGGRGQLNYETFRPEAEIFSDELEKYGVDRSDIILEFRAENSGQNVQLGVSTLLEHGMEVRRLIAVCTPFIARRCLATFELQFPGIEVHLAPPEGDLLEFVNRPRVEFAMRIVDEFRRLQEYPAQGFIAEVDIPDRVLQAVSRIGNICK